MNKNNCELTQTQQNWSSLKRLSVSFFCSLRKENPDWTVEDLLDAFNLPRTALMLELAASAAFVCATEPTTAEVCRVLAQHMNGVHSPEIIERSTGIAIVKVQRILESCAAGYGKAPFGSAAFGGNRAVSDGKAAVCRRTTVKGQLSYRGHRYNLGALYCGRTVFVRERDRELLISCDDRSPVHVTRYLIR